MAFGYLVLALYFRSTGGYTVEHLDGGGDSGEETGAESEMTPADSENVDGGSDEMTPADSENVYGGSDDAG